ncbi:MAG: response regulator [Gammaproteobacteria bacterium]|nr:response regulator [Gammaproteobacteria bacterium]
MPISYSQKKVLIVDDFADFRRTVRGIVVQIGIADIDQAATAEEALKMCRDKHYDIVLSDYNLGDGKDGQQLLEELKYVSLLKNKDVFLMITAENTSSMVMGALDCMPDGYLTKPFNKGMLQNRLEKILEKKESLAEIEVAIEKKQYDKAMSLCKAQLAAKSPHALACLRLQAEILEATGELEAAAAIYREVNGSRPLVWALLGLGRVLFHQKELAKSRLQFEELIRLNPMFLTAFDWLAKIQAAEGDAKKAQQTLETAVKISPKTINRQMNLGQLAKENEDVDGALKAYRSAVRLGKNSCYNTPENYFNFNECVQQVIKRDGLSQNKALAEDGVRYLQEASEVYKNQKDVVFRLENQKVGLFQVQGRAQEAQAAMSKAEHLYPQVEAELNSDGLIDFAKALKTSGKEAKAQEIVASLASKHGDNPEVMKLANELLQDREALRKATESHNLNNDGVRQFEAGEALKAVATFLKARELSPTNTSVNFNIAQVIYHMHKSGQADANMIKVGKHCLGQVNMDKKDARFAKYQELQRLYADIPAPAGE